jgi:hypothetical protein
MEHGFCYTREKCLEDIEERQELAPGAHSIPSPAPLRPQHFILIRDKERRSPSCRCGHTWGWGEGWTGGVASRAGPCLGDLRTSHIYPILISIGLYAHFPPGLVSSKTGELGLVSDSGSEVCALHLPRAGLPQQNQTLALGDGPAGSQGLVKTEASHS